MIIGSTLSHYRVLQLLGRGGMGEVYAAEDLTLRRRVALKVLPPDMAADPERRRRFEREAQAVASLNHPGIVTIYSVEHDEGRTFLTMELLEGRTLEQAVPRDGLPLPEFLRIAVPLADAINAAHGRGILHRDLKPGNVMLTNDGRIKVLDFGLAKLVEPAPTAALQMAPGSLTTSAGQIVGTLAYMAPEQAEGKAVDHRADIFALGVLLYELATGIRPFAGESNVAVLTALLRDTPRPLSEMRRDLPASLGPIIQRCLEKDPEQRYQSAAEVSAALQSVDGGVRRPPAHSGRWILPAAASVVLLVGVGAWWQLADRSETLIAPPVGTITETAVLITGRQVALLDFSNRTGDPTMDAFGRMVSEAVATALASEGFAVVNATDASAGDGLTIAGAYFIEGDDLRFDAQLLSASRGTVVRAPDPIRSSRTSLLLAADHTSRTIMSEVRRLYESQRRSP